MVLAFNISIALSSSNLTQAALPDQAAKCRGLLPSESRTRREAPCLRSSKMTSQLPVTAAKWQAVFPSGSQVASALAPRSRQLCAINLYYIAACGLPKFLCECGSLGFLMLSLTGSRKISRFIVKYSTTAFSHN